MLWIDRLHRWTGGIAGLLLTLIGLSGALLVHRDALVMLPHAHDRQLQDMAMLASSIRRIAADGGTAPATIMLASDHLGLHRVTYGDGAGAYFDQAGDRIAAWFGPWERPELLLLDFHEHLLAGPFGQSLAVLGAVAGLFCLGTGILLWWRTRKTFAFRLWPARMSRPAIMRQHRDFGVVMAPLLFLSLATGLVLGLQALFALGPTVPVIPLTASPGHASMATRTGIDWPGIIGEAHRRFPEAEFRSIAFPQEPDGRILVRMRQPWEWQPNGNTMLCFSPRTMRPVAMRDPARSSAPARFYALLYPLHAARVGGLGYRIVMTMSGLALAMLGTFAIWTFWFCRPKRTMVPKRKAGLAA